MIKAYKTQLRTRRRPELKETFRQWAGCARYVYNWALDKKKTAWQERSESLSAYDLDKMVTHLKKRDDHTWLSDPPRRVLYYAVQDLDAAFQGFFRRVKNGEAPGYPRFKAKGRSKPSFSVYGSDVEVEDHRIRLPKAGWIRLEEKGYIPTDADKYGRVTVSRDADKWMVSVMVHEPDAPGRSLQDRPAATDTIALHPGVRHWARAFADGEGTFRRGSVAEFDLPEKLEMLQKRLGREQRKLSRKEGPGKDREPSRSYLRQRKRVEKVHQKIRRIRQDATHQLTSYLCYTLSPERLVVQDWDVRSMLQQDLEDVPRAVARRIRFSIANANFGEMLRQIRYKSEWAGIERVEIESGVPVSQRCSECGHVHKELGARMRFVCPACDHETDRESNALQNLLGEADKALDSETENA